jgi:hypothetical protein
LGADWEPQSDDATKGQQHSEAPGSNGDVVAETAYDAHFTGTAEFIYKGSATDYGTATSGALDASNALPGKYKSTAAVTILSVEIDYGPCAQGERERVRFTWSKGLTADSAIYKPTLTAALATKQENAGVPALLTNANADSKITAATYTLSCQEGRVLTKVGEYLAGATYKGQEQLNLSYVGRPSLTTTGWIVTGDQSPSGAGAATNTGYDTYNVTAAKKVTRV